MIRLAFILVPAILAISYSEPAAADSEAVQAKCECGNIVNRFGSKTWEKIGEVTISATFDDTEWDLYRKAGTLCRKKYREPAIEARLCKYL